MSATTTRDLDRARLMHHLSRFPEDLLDIRRLQRRYCLTNGEVLTVLRSWERPVEPGTDGSAGPHH